MYVTRYAWEMGGSLGIRGCSNTSQQEQFVTSNQSAYNSFAAAAAHLQPTPTPTPPHPRKEEEKRKKERKKKKDKIKTLAHK